MSLAGVRRVAILRGCSAGCMHISPLPQKIASFDIVRLIGEGGMSCVYEGRNGSFVHAIKTIRTAGRGEAEIEELERRFAAEAETGALLGQHPNIVQVFNAGRDGKVAYLDMELVRGDDLTHTVGPGRPVPPGRAAAIVLELLAALAYAHARGVIHRDIKPGNVMIDRDGRVKLMDFGIARSDSSGDETRETAHVLGTPRFMSPEQILCKDLDARTDLWSVGVLLFLLLTGRQPFDGSDAEIFRQILNETPPVPSQLQPDLPPGIDAVVARALQRQPASRYASADEFAADLRPYAEMAQAAPTPVPATRPRRPLAASPMAVAIMAAAIGVSGAVVGDHWSGRQVVRSEPCAPPRITAGGACACPPGQAFDGSACTALAGAACKPPEVAMGGSCVSCATLRSQPLIYNGLGCEALEATDPGRPGRP